MVSGRCRLTQAKTFPKSGVSPEQTVYETFFAVSVLNSDLLSQSLLHSSHDEVSTCSQGQQPEHSTNA
jgi:hypothetical protein